MVRYEIAEAQAALETLIERAARGESVIITRAGKPVARLAPPMRAGELVGLLRALQAGQPMSPVSSADLIRQERDEQ
jgi:prevent-host-death family protein